MGDRPINPPVPVSLEEAARILEPILGSPCSVVSLRPLSGGCVCTVLEATLDGDHPPVVIKASAASGGTDPALRREHHVLRHIRAHTTFPVPEPLGCDVTATEVPFSYLVMERLPGRNLGESGRALSAPERLRLERDMADAVAALHEQTAPRYGALGSEETWESWGERMAHTLAELARDVAPTGRLEPWTLNAIDQIVEQTPTILEGCGPPVLVHGDIWATNIMVDRGELSGFLDADGLLAPAEHDLAYLQIWNTVGEAFFTRYHEHHLADPGYHRRRPIYWLATLLIHVWLFGERGYVEATEETLQSLGYGPADAPPRE